MIKLLSEIKITESGKQRQAENELQPTLIYILNDSSASISGKHTVHSDSELIYIDNHYNISKVAADLKTTTTLIKHTNTTWKPRCMYFSPSSGDLLVGMSRYNTHILMILVKVMRYNDSCQLTQAIPKNITKDNLYQNPRYITENNNGDVLVFDWDRCAVVVTSRKGIHRFSYTGPPIEPALLPYGVCTDALS